MIRTFVTVEFECKHDFLNDVIARVVDILEDAVEHEDDVIAFSVRSAEQRDIDPDDDRN